MSGNVAQIIEQLAKQFAVLDRAIQRTQGEVNSLISGMRAIAREGRAAADAWNQAARAMQSAARAGKAASGSVGGGAPSGASAAASAGIAAGTYGPGSANNYGGPRRITGPLPQLLLTGPSGGGSGGGGFTLNGGPYGTGFRTVGSPYNPGAGPVGPFMGGPPAGGGGGGGGGGLPGFPGGGGGGPGGIPLAGGPYVNNPNFPNNYRYTPGRGTNFSQGGLGSAIGAYKGFEWLGEFFEAGAKFDDWLIRLHAQGLTEEEVKKASALAFKLQKDIKPTKVSENLKLLSEMMSTIQNGQEALELLPEFAKAEVALGRAGNTHGSSEMQALIKEAEYRGALKTKLNPETGEQEADKDELRKFIHNVLTAAVVSGGLYGPTQQLQLLRSSGYTGANLSDESMFAKNMVMSQALGPGGAGTALRGFEQQFTAGKMGTASANLLMEMGILKGGPDVKHNPFVRKNGPFNVFIDPRAYPEGMQIGASKNPDSFIIDYLFPKIRDYLAKKLGPQYTGANDGDKRIMEQNYVGTLASTQTAAKEIAEVFRVVSLIDRDVQAYEKAFKRPVGEILTTNNPVIEGQGLGSSLNALSTTLGLTTMGTAIRVIDNLTHSLNGLSEFATNHATIVNVGLTALGGALTGLAAIGIVALAVSLGSTAAALAALGAATAIAMHYISGLDDVLRGLAPGAYKTVDKTREGLATQGGAMLPWWAPVPGEHSEPPSWVPWGHGQSNAPIPRSGGSDGRQDHSMHIESVSPQAARTIAMGVAGNLNRHFNRPSAGVTGHDSTMDPLGGMMGTNLG